jgi:hypothetical protein
VQVNASFGGAEAKTKHVDAQFSIDSGILLHVSGVMVLKVGRRAAAQQLHDGSAQPHPAPAAALWPTWPGVPGAPWGERELNCAMELCHEHCRAGSATLPRHSSWHPRKTATMCTTTCCACTRQSSHRPATAAAGAASASRRRHQCQLLRAQVLLSRRQPLAVQRPRLSLLHHLHQTAQSSRPLPQQHTCVAPPPPLLLSPPQPPPPRAPPTPTPPGLNG